METQLALDDIVTIVVAVVSSLGAVTLSAYLAEFLSDKREQKRARGLALSCLESVRIQMIEVKSSLTFLTHAEWGTENLAVLSMFLRDFKPMDMALFSKVRGSLLNLNSELSEAVTNLELLVMAFNKTSKAMSSVFSDAKEAADFVNSSRPYFGGLMEVAAQMSMITIGLRTQILQNKRAQIDWDSLFEKVREVNSELLSTPNK